jgi:teichuronic acid biosynthesis glycosyltransferase TuaH
MMPDRESVHQDWQGLVIFCAGTAWDGAGFPTEKHIATRLSARVPVLYVDPPSSALAAYRDGTVRRRGLRVVQPGLAVLSPSVLPAKTWLVMRKVTSMLTCRAIARAVASLGVKRARALVLATYTDLFAAVEADRRVMYATDDFVAGAKLMSLPRAHLAREEGRQAASADCVVVVSQDLARRWRRLGHEPVFIPNGCDTDRFADTDNAPWPDDVDLPRPIAGLFGHLSDRIDQRLLEAVIARGHSVLLVGSADPSFPLDRLLARPNVRYVGRKPFESMPSYLRAIDVGLTPYADNEFNRASFPIKTLEYLAAGRLAVSTDLPSVRWLGSRLIGVAREPADFADAVDRFMRRPRTSDLVKQCQAFARQHSWAVRTQEFGDLIGLREVSKGRDVSPLDWEVPGEAAGEQCISKVR